VANRANYVKIGLFVILGLLGALVLAVALGATQGRRERVAIYTYLDESVQGLDVGSAVTFRGVRVGEVGDITIAPDHRLVAVRMDVDVRSLQQLGLVPKGKLRASDVPAPPADLRAQLTSQGLTGTKSMSIDFVDANANPPRVLTFTPPGRYMPSTPSLTKDLEDSLVNAMARVTVLVDHVTPVVDGVGRVVADLDRGGAGEKAAESLDRVNRVVGQVERARIAENAGNTVERLNAVLGDLQGDHGLVHATQRSVTEFGEAGRNVAGATQELGPTLSEIREAASAFRELADQLQREPDSLLKGRARRPQKASP
jgi:ABC-type transporter Mla subunit MlaD